ncbi:HEAT repeat domain-containing protein [Empedobacter stercoris]|uniref:HEAT repeat domain-containing protein n=1 Tax=Empedobacter stercoris TaxID=1628248 RepID=UPI0021AEEFBB|nr:HEAT repeat domain-containing protein [Empedobacter stercoris]UWX68083.1 HEAT repeat domain-containing protein [Empedobacter stercoris]
MKDSLKKHIENKREDFENKMPSDMLWAKIKTQIPLENSEVVVKTEIGKNKTVSYWSIAASVLVVFGISFFFFNQSKVEVPKTLVKTSQKKVVVEQINKTEDKIEIADKINSIPDYSTESQLTKLKAKDKIDSSSEKIISKPTESTNNALFKQLQDEFSTSNRIDALAKLAQVDELNQNELELIKRVTLNDPNTIVRLNSIEVLANKLPEKSINQEMKEIFMSQDDPMIQMELINVLTKVNNHSLDAELIQKLQEIILDPQTKPFVKDEAYAVLLKK